MKVEILIAGIAILLTAYGSASAHSPHHVITDVAVSPNYSSDGSVFILIQDQLFRSADGKSGWKNLINGLDNQYTLTSLAISPAFGSDQVVFVASSGDGIYRSSDGGDSWNRVNAELGTLNVSKLSISPAFETDGRLLAATKAGGLWRNDGSADEWQRVLPVDVRVTSLHEHQSANATQSVFAADEDGTIYRSADGGVTWKVISRLPGSENVTSIDGSGETLFIGSKTSGLYRSLDGGRTLTAVRSFESVRQTDCEGNQLDVEVLDQHITSINLSPTFSDDRALYVSTWYNAVFVSTDGGETWSSWQQGIRCNAQADAERAPHFSSVSISKDRKGKLVFWLAAFDGLFHGHGAGSAWKQLETLPLGLIKGWAVTNGSHNRPVVALGTYGGGFYRTDDLGSTWTIGNRGLKTTRLTGIAFSSDYVRDKVIFAGADRQLLWSKDRGTTWTSINLQEYGLGARIAFRLHKLGVPKSWTRGLYDPGHVRNVYPTHIITLPALCNSKALFATRFHGVMEFDRSSGDIASVWDGTDRIMNSFEMSPAFERDHTLIASVRGEGLIRSTDGGRSWQPINNGLQFIEQWSKNSSAGNYRRDISVAMSPDYENDAMIFAGTASADGLYVTNDGGKHWRKSSVTKDGRPTAIIALAISPEFREDQTLIVSVKGHGLYLSMDRGHSYEPFGSELLKMNASIEHLEFSANFANDNLILAASDEQLLVSHDRGQTWSGIVRPVRYEDMRDVFRFQGNWEQRKGDSYSAMTETVTSAQGSSVRLRFVGTGIRWLGSKGPDHGRAQVVIDGETVATVDSSAIRNSELQELFVVENLPHGSHVIEIRVPSNATIRRPGLIAIDAVDILVKDQAGH